MGELKSNAQRDMREVAPKKADKAEVADRAGDVSLAAVFPRLEGERASNIAELNHLLTLMATDIRELERSLQKELIFPDTDSEEAAQNFLHAFSALLTVRINIIEDTCAAGGIQTKFINMLEDLRSTANAIRFYPLKDIAVFAPTMMKKFWSAIGEMGLAWGPIHVRQYDGQIHKAGLELISRLEEISDELVIDLRRSAPQNGFGRRVPASEFEEMLAAKGARLFVLHDSGVDVGFFIVYSDRTGLPPDTEKSLKRMEKSADLAGKNVGWLPIVGISQAGRDHLQALGINAYDLLSSALAQSCHTLGLDRLYGEVRMGAQANLARKSHLRVGFKGTGIETQHGSFPYEILSLDPKDVKFLVQLNLLQDGIDIPHMLHAASTKLPSLETIIKQWNYRDPKSVGQSEFCLLNGDTSKLAAYVNKHLASQLRYQVLQLSDGLAVQFRDGDRSFVRLFTIRQIVPNQDLWTCDFAADHYRITTFGEALGQLDKEFNRH